MNTKRAGRLAMITLSLTALALMTGCEVFGFAANAFSSRKTPAVYKPKDLPTVILVDDPSLLLQDPGLTGTIAMTIASVLKEKGVLTQIVDIQKVAELSAEMGSAFARTPIDQIGRKLNAVQVIHVHINSVPPFQSEPGVLKPIAGVLVKVFDAEYKVRLFPPAEHLKEQPAVPTNRGAYELTVAARLRVVDGNTDNAMSAYRLRFAEKIGTEVANLFYEHDATKDLRTD